jgi:hypothetical protein
MDGPLVVAPPRLAASSAEPPPAVDAAPPPTPVRLTALLPDALPLAAAPQPGPSARGTEPPAAAPATLAARPAPERPPALAAAPTHLRPALRFAEAPPANRPRVALSLPPGSTPDPDALGFALATPP